MEKEVVINQDFHTITARSTDQLQTQLYKVLDLYRNNRKEFALISQVQPVNDKEFIVIIETIIEQQN
ncbi:hypothetical protein [Alteribacillus bidgolensis]|uniref:Uncharacterized protein n=1 Tax=Alteribacillus bidgolensis TaxID=930129 RepID=A0A1G8P661_9BACI|nr:hypothetical protein [Alteribacillus bidgolensis]SDI87922.1 hypothetical protein SAMN05216352_113136 [Alteribacillus bidgolensis]